MAKRPKKPTNTSAYGQVALGAAGVLAGAGLLTVHPLVGIVVVGASSAVIINGIKKLRAKKAEVSYNNNAQFAKRSMLGKIFTSNNLTPAKFKAGNGLHQKVIALKDHENPGSMINFINKMSRKAVMKLDSMKFSQPTMELIAAKQGKLMSPGTFHPNNKAHVRILTKMLKNKQTRQDGMTIIKNMVPKKREYILQQNIGSKSLRKAVATAHTQVSSFGSSKLTKAASTKRRVIPNNSSGRSYRLQSF